MNWLEEKGINLDNYVTDFCSFVSLYHPEIERFTIPRNRGSNRRPVWYTIHHPNGIPQKNEPCFFWLINKKVNPLFPKGRTFRIRIYQPFNLLDTFIQPNREFIEKFLKKATTMPTEIKEWQRETFGCHIYQEIKSYVMDNLLSSDEIKKYPKKHKEKTMLILDPEKLNLVRVTVVNPQKIEILEDKTELVFGKDDIRFQAGKYATFGDTIAVEYAVISQYPLPKEESQLEKLLREILEQKQPKKS